MLESVISDWPSLFFYVFIFVISTVFVYFGLKIGQDKKYVKIFLISLGLLLPITLAGIRYYVGADYKNYAGMVHRAQAGEAIWPRDIEPFSNLLIYISAFFGTNLVLFFGFATLTIVFAFLAIKRMTSNQPLIGVLSWFAYLSVIYPTTFNAVRSGLAVSVAMYAFSFLVDTSSRHRLVKFMGLVVLASLFHVSALVCLPIGVAVYEGERQRRSRPKVTNITLIISLLLALMFPLLGGIVAAAPMELISNYARYFTKAGESFYLPIISIIMLIILGISAFLNKSSILKNDRLLNLLNIASFYAPFAVIVGWLSYYTGTSRLLFYIDPIILVLFAYAFERIYGGFPKNKLRKTILLVLFFLVCITLMSRNLVWAHALPYDTIF